MGKSTYSPTATGNSPKRETDERQIATALRKQRTEATLEKTSFYTEQLRSVVLAGIHGHLFKIYIINEVSRADACPMNERMS